MESYSNKQRAQRNAAYFRKVFGTSSLEDVRDQLESSTGGGGSGGFGNLEVATGDDSERGPLESLDVLIADPTGTNLQESDHHNLEAIIHETGRPAIIVEDDSFDTSNLTPEWVFLGEAGVREKIETAIMSVGRIEAPFDLRRPYAGTGFVVGENLIMTNRHVAEIFASGLGTSTLNFYPGASAGVDFKRELHRRGAPAPVVLHVDKVVMIHPFWDMALLKMKENLGNDREPLKLSTKTPDDLKGKKVVVIGYPGKDTRSNARVRDQIFEGRYGIKRLLPGDNDGPVKYNGLDVMAHDTSTLGGASGSAVLDLESGEIVGLHYAGVYMESNYAVPLSSLAADSRVAEFSPKLRFTGTRTPDASVKDVWETIERGESLVAETDAPNAQEGLFGDPPPDVDPILPQFDFTSLTNTGFSWPAALSTALASHVAYMDKVSVQQNCESWQLEKCHFVEKDNTECFVAGNSETAIVAFRGTEAKIKDWLIDLNFIGTTQSYGRVHRGFWAAFQSVSDLLDVAIADLGTPKLILTGHSLGGALALIAAAEWFGKHDVHSIYTYGQPAVGKGTFTEFMDGHISGAYHRVVNDDDIVPMVPPTYRHTGKLSQFGAGNELKVGGSSSNESMIESGETCTELQFDHLRMTLLQERLTNPETRVGTQEGLLPSFKDHSLARYIGKIAANV